MSDLLLSGLVWFRIYLISSTQERTASLLGLPTIILVRRPVVKPFQSQECYAEAPTRPLMSYLKQGDLSVNVFMWDPLPIFSEHVNIAYSKTILELAD